MSMTQTSPTGVAVIPALEWAPIIGGAIGGFVYRWLSPDEPKPVDVAGR